MYTTSPDVAHLTRPSGQGDLGVWCELAGWIVVQPPVDSLLPQIPVTPKVLGTKLERQSCRRQRYFGSFLARTS
jgi:hypothetical protein